MSALHIAGEIKPMFINNSMVYRIYNGEKWVRLDDPSLDRIWDLMDVDERTRAITREYYLELDQIADAERLKRIEQ